MSAKNKRMRKLFSCTIWIEQRRQNAWVCTIIEGDREHVHEYRYKHEAQHFISDYLQTHRQGRRKTMGEERTSPGRLNPSAPSTTPEPVSTDDDTDPGYEDGGDNESGIWQSND